MPKLPVYAIIFSFMSLFIMYPREGRGWVKDNIERQFEYAESLFEEGDYYRAITEYKRYIFFFSEGEKTARCYFRIGESYFNAKKWTSAIDALNVFITRFSYSPMLNDALYLKGMAEKISRDMKMPFQLLIR